MSIEICTECDKQEDTDLEKYGEIDYENKYHCAECIEKAVSKMIGDKNDR